MIKYIFCILIGIFFVYGAGYTASIEETAELPAEVTATFVSQYAGDHSLFNDETAESKVCDAIRTSIITSLNIPAGIMYTR